jgi:hypothetical protein
MLATTVAVHRIENVTCRNGLHGDAACGVLAGGVLVSGSAIDRIPFRLFGVTRGQRRGSSFLPQKFIVRSSD